jgi:protease-4
MKKQTLLLSVLLLSASAAGFSMFERQGKAAVISLSGNIQPSSQGFSSDGMTPQQVRELTTRALEKNPDALIYEINSGGGAVVASKEVMRSIDSVEKPTVCRIRDIGASGAYLAALGCDRIVADSLSMTGSIGVRASYLEFSGLMQKLGVEHVNLTAGSRKDTGSRYRNITSEEKELLQQKIDTIHDQFVTVVQERRNLSRSETETVETGEAFLGKTAKEIGLVDSLGGRETALEAAGNMTGRELSVVEIRRPEQFSFLSLLTGSTGLDIFSVEAPFSSSYR